MRVLKTLGKVTLFGIVLFGVFVMNCIGAIICAITKG